MSSSVGPTRSFINVSHGQPCHSQAKNESTKSVRSHTRRKRQKYFAPPHRNRRSE